MRRLIEENAGVPAAMIHDDSTIQGNLAMDSMSFVSLQVAVEETFGISCTLADIEEADRFDAIAALVHTRANGRDQDSSSRAEKPTPILGHDKRRTASPKTPGRRPRAKK